MAPLLPTEGVATPSLSSTQNSMPAHQATTALSNAPSPPPITGGGTVAEHSTNTTIFCWIPLIQLHCGFLLQHQKCIKALCCGTLLYAVSVLGNRSSPPPPTNTSSDPKILRHLFRERGQPLPWQRQTRRKTCCHLRKGWRIRPCASDNKGGPLCMPLCFWAAQTAVAASELCVGTGRSMFSPYLPPHTAATAIQRVYPSSVDKESEGWQKLSWAGYALDCDMNWAMCNLQDSNTFVFLVGDY
jgi:hypothetical protein